MQAHRLLIKVAELNTPSDGNGITGIPSAVFCSVFFTEMGNKKKKKYEIKRRRHLRTLSQLHAFSFFKCKFEKCLMTAKAMCLRIKVAQLNTLSVGKEITGIPTGYRFFIEMENENTNLRKLADV